MAMFDYLRDWGEYIQFGVLVVLILFLVLNIVLFVKLGKMKKRYDRFMSGKEGKDLEEAILNKFELLDGLNQTVGQMGQDIKKIQGNLLIAYQKVGVVKYDAFQEVGGKLSFVLALLTKEDDGFIMNCMHSSREGCFTYIKEVEKGEAFVILSEEEAQALQEAKSNRKFIK